MSDTTDRAAALLALQDAVPLDAEPVLTDLEVERILERNKRAQRWVANTALLLGTVVMPTVRMGRVYKVTTQGTTGTVEPSWIDSDDAEVTSGTVTFTEAGVDFINTYNIRAAIEEAWALKAGKAAELHEDDAELISSHCEERVKAYQTPMIA